MTVHVLGIRHHGPGSARNVRSFLEELKPDIVLVEGPPEADEILQWAAARYPAINLATIYRTLDLLISIGLVAQSDFGSGVSYFELVGEAPHHHLVCEHCHAVMEIDAEALRPMHENILRDYGFLTNTRHLALFGSCRACQEALVASIP